MKSFIRLSVAFLLSVATFGLKAASSESEAYASADTLRAGSSMRLPMPVEVTAEDFVTKVYGVLSPAQDKESLCRDCHTKLRMMPEEDEMGLWLQKDDGYQLSYYGMKPDCTAMARIGDKAVSDFAFFFLFPYEAGKREAANRRQSEFTGSLLQEMKDIGLTLDSNLTTDALLELYGDYEGNLVELRLIEEGTSIESQPTDSARDGRFVLLLRVEPGAYTAADRHPAD